MISDINEIPNIINNNSEVEKINLIYKDNDLTKCCIDLIEAGYIPKLKFQGNRITFIYCEFNNIKIKIETQHLLKNDLNGLLCINDETIYNKMSECMNKFYKSLFVKKHKNHYSNIDINIFKSIICFLQK